MVESFGATADVNAHETPRRARGFDLLLLALSFLLAAGSFGTWQEVHYTAIFSVPPGFTSRGIDRWGGPGWMTLLLAVVLVISIALAEATRSKIPRAVTSSLFGSALVVTAIAMAEYLIWFSGGPLASKSVGWGLWLCFVAAFVGLGTSILWSTRTVAGTAEVNASAASETSRAFRRVASSYPLLLTLAILAGIGSFGTWSTFRYPILSRSPIPLTGLSTISGIERWGGQGWMTLLLSILISISIVFAVITRARIARVVAASLFGSMLVVASMSVVEYLIWYPKNLWYPTYPGVSSTSIGWGLWMCLVVALVGFGLSLRWSAPVVVKPVDDD